MLMNGWLLRMTVPDGSKGAQKVFLIADHCLHHWRRNKASGVMFGELHNNTSQASNNYILPEREHHEIGQKRWS
jgi:hypothetical protein